MWSTQLIKQYGPISPVAEYLAKIKGTWRGVPTAIGSQVKPCQSRFDLYKEHCGIDLVDMFPADESKYDKAKTDKWTWDLYLEAAQKLHKAGYPGRLADGTDQRRGRLGRRVVQVLRRGHDRREGQHQGQLGRNPHGAGIPEEADGGESARGLRVG